MIAIKRIYEELLEEDGFRILIDRLWPRGLSKEKAKIDMWVKEIAPSDKLRKTFSHEVDKWDNFKKQYQLELWDNIEMIKKIKEIEIREKKITLLYSAKDKDHNNAVVLIDFLKNWK